MKISILSENTAVGRGIRGEHGLAFLVETGHHRVLFDTGQGLVLEENAAAMGRDLSNLDAMVLSHGHYDHTGAVAEVVRCQSRRLPVYAHPDCLLERYRIREGKPHAVGLPASARAALSDRQVDLRWSRDACRVVPGVTMTGEIPRRHSEETGRENFTLDPEGLHPDPLRDDQSLAIATSRGVVVLLGCAHAGVINTLDRVVELSGDRPLLAVIGGTHLRSAGRERLDWTMEALWRFDIGLLVPLHCSGGPAVHRMWQAFPDRFRMASAGETLSIEE